MIFLLKIISGVYTWYKDQKWLREHSIEFVTVITDIMISINDTFLCHKNKTFLGDSYKSENVINWYLFR